MQPFSQPIRLYHEAPISVLNDVQVITGGDYALVHLFDEHPEYYDFFKKAVADGRNVILDNSLFELGVTFNPYEFHQHILNLRPTEYIIPDQFNSCTGTVMMAKQWKRQFPNTPGISIGVVHGESLEEAIECYQQLEPLVDKIAFNFADTFFTEALLNSTNPAHITGRQVLIDELLKRGVMNTNKPVHLLGCTIMAEFLRYKNRKYNFIQSIDTSNPVLMAINKRSYIAALNGMDTKPSGKLVDFITLPRDEINMDLLTNNIHHFREWV